MLAALILTLAQRPVLLDRMTRVERDKRAAILSELGEPGLPEWAGEYTEFVLAPRSGFMDTHHSCMGSYYSTGSVRADGTRLELTLDGSPRCAVTWWRVPWDARRYLVPEDQLSTFCMLVNDGTEPRTEFEGWFDMRTVGTQQLPQGLPVLPERWQLLLLASPLKSRILRVERAPARPKPYSADHDLESRVMLRLGSNDGVRPGLGFYLGRNGFVRAFVESVESSACVVLVDERYERLAKYLKPGDYAGTKRPW
jgi:hypothetical protein